MIEIGGWDNQSLWLDLEVIMNNTTWDSTIGDGGMRIETPEKLTSFFDDIEKVYKKYGLSIEGSHAGFSIRKYNEKDMEILRDATKNFK